MPEIETPNNWSTSQVDFLTPEQRVNAIAEILATLALRAMQRDSTSHDHDDQNA